MTFSRLTYLVIGLVLVIIIGGVYYFSTLTTTNPSTGETRSVFGALFPFLGSNPTEAPGGSDDEIPGEIDTRPVPKLRLVTENPVAGAYFVDNSTTTTDIRFVERETGHVFDTPTTGFNTTRISNTTIPRIQEVVWETGKAFIIRYLSDEGAVQNFLATIASTSPEQTLSGKFLGAFDRVSVSADGKKIFTVTETPEGSRLESTNADGTKPKTLFASPIRSWVPITNANTPLIQTAPSSGIPGFLYSLGSQGVLVPLISNEPGLMTLPSPSGKYILYSTGAGNTVTLSVFETKTEEHLDLPLQTVASKCVWFPKNEPLIFCGAPNSVPQSNYPDDWLIGFTSFSDSAWVIDPVAGTAKRVSYLQDEAGRSIDVFEPRVNDRGEYALFMNKSDLSLWSLKLEISQ